MVLKAYFDDSGKLGDPVETAAVVGGVIASADEWDKLEPEWWAVLCAFKVKEFHSVDFAHSRGDFLGWSKEEEKRREFLGRLTSIIDRHLHNPSKPIGTLLPLLQFQMLPKDKQTEWGDDPYFVCLQHSIQLAAVHAQDLYIPPSDLEIFCDEQPKFQPIAERVYKACRSYLPSGIGERLGGFTFGNSKKWAGLQVADLVAYEALQLRRDMIAEKDDLVGTIRWPLTQLMKMQVEFEFFTAQKLWEHEPLTNYTTGDHNDTQ